MPKMFTGVPFVHRMARFTGSTLFHATTLGQLMAAIYNSLSGAIITIIGTINHMIRWKSGKKSFNRLSDCQIG